MIRIVIGAAEQSVAYELRAALTEMESVDAVFVAESTDELVSAVLRLDPDVVLVHDQLGPDPVLPVIRDLALRRATCAALVVTTSPTAAQFSAAMDAGARGIVSYPPTFEELQTRVAAAGDIAQQMRRMMGGSGDSSGSGGGSRAQVVTVTGAKGGVGTTTIATHLALDVVRTVPGHRVCLVDLDLEKGDVSGVLQVRHRASIADVAKVSEDLSAQAVGDAVVVHESGLHLLLAPIDVRDTEAVDPRSLREVVVVLRSEYDLVIIDAGSHVTPAQATVVELADEVICVATPDVLCMRGLRRAISQWEGLGVRKEADVNVLLNRMSRQTTVSAETVRQLTRAPVLPVGLPAMFRRLEPALNSRDPLSLNEDVWWRALRAIGAEVGVVKGRETKGGREADPGLPRPGRGRLRGRRSEAGQASLESIGILPLLVTVCLLVWQLGIYGVSLVWSGHAANVAARAVSLHEDPGAAARDSVPGYVASNLAVSTSGSTVTVRLRVPLVAPASRHSLGTITSRRTVVMEP